MLFMSYVVAAQDIPSLRHFPFLSSLVKFQQLSQNVVICHSMFFCNIFSCVRRYLFAHLPRDILLELVAELYLRLHDAKLSLLPVDSGAKIHDQSKGMMLDSDPFPAS